MSELNQTALKIVSNNKGILAADESTPSMLKKFDSINVKSNPENRLKYREILFSADGMKNYIGGVILFDETLKQTTISGKSIPELINQSGAVIGIKVDAGTKFLAGSPEEKITEGLDGLRERLLEYYKLGARFTKWRAIYKISLNFNLFSGVDFTFTESNRFVIVPELSSAANIPLPFETIFNAI